MITEGMKIEPGMVLVITYKTQTSIKQLHKDKYRAIQELSKAMQCEPDDLPVGILQVGEWASTVKLLSKEPDDMGRRQIDIPNCRKCPARITEDGAGCCIFDTRMKTQVLSVPQNCPIRKVNGGSGIFVSIAPDAKIGSAT